MASGVVQQRLATAARRATGRLVDAFDRQLVNDIYRSSFTRQTGVSLKVCG